LRRKNVPDKEVQHERMPYDHYHYHNETGKVQRSASACQLLAFCNLACSGFDLFVVVTKSVMGSAVDLKRTYKLSCDVH